MFLAMTTLLTPPFPETPRELVFKTVHQSFYQDDARLLSLVPNG
jgi:hypothetical protein